MTGLSGYATLRSMILGAHCSTAGGVWTALERGRSIGCDAVQLFVKNNMQWLGRAFTPDELARWMAARESTALRAVFGHAGYLINLAAPPSPNRDRSVESLVQELELAEALGLPFLVLHPGAHLGKGEEQGMKRVSKALDEVFRATRRFKVRVALENTAGQGSCLGGKVEHLRAIHDRVGARRLGICLDTAHLFAAGYDIRRRQVWDGAMAQAALFFGSGNLLAIHLNDSKAPLGSQVDRHAGIGEGEIGLRAFAHIVNDPRLRDVPACLETPKSKDLHEDVENLARLRSLLAKARGSRLGAGVRKPAGSLGRRANQP